MSKKDFYREIQIKNPCSKDWETMHGNDIVRFCDHCAKHVNNLSAMTEKEALRLVRKSRGRICIRYIQDPQTNQPLFSEQLIPISRRAPLMAAGVMSASLSLSTLAFAQSGTPAVEPAAPAVPRVSGQSRPDSADKENPVDKTGSTGSVSGTVTDPNGAVVPNAAVVILDSNGNQLIETKTGDDGSYSLENIPADAHTLAVYAPGFVPSRIEQLSFTDGANKTVNATLEVGGTLGGAVVISRREYEQPLAKAVEQNDVDAVRNLIAQGEDVNGKEDDKTTPLFIAIENGNLEITKVLLDFGAKINARNAEKETPLMRLNDNASKELIELLLRNGAKVNLTAKDGNTALILAAQNAKPEVLQALIDADAEVNAKNEEGQTALMNAAYADDIEKVRILLHAGAEVNAKNSEDETAYDQTAENEIEQLLVSFGAIAKEKPKDDSDDTPPDN